MPTALIPCGYDDVRTYWYLIDCVEISLCVQLKRCDMGAPYRFEWNFISTHTQHWPMFDARSALLDNYCQFKWHFNIRIQLPNNTHKPQHAFINPNISRIQRIHTLANSGHAATAQRAVSYL